MQASRRDANELRHRAIHAIAKPLPLRAQLVAACPAHDTRAADARRGFTDDPVPLPQAGDGAAKTSDSATEFMAKHDGDIDLP